MDRVKANTDLVSTTFGLISIFIVALFANKLLEPIKNRQDHELAGEKFGGVFQGLKNLILTAIGKPVVPVETTYSFFLNLLLPFLLVCLASAIALFVVYHLVKSFGDYEDSLLNKFLKVIFILIFVAVVSFLVPVALHLLWLNFKVLFAMLLIVGLILGVVVHKGSQAKSE